MHGFLIQDASSLISRDIWQGRNIDTFQLKLQKVSFRGHNLTFSIILRSILRVESVDPKANWIGRKLSILPNSKVAWVD